MKLIINGTENFDKVTGNTLKEILDHVQSNMLMPGTLIRNLIVNDQSIDLNSQKDSDQESLTMPKQEIETLEIEIVAIQDIITKNIENAEDYLIKLIPGIEKAAELFQKEDELEANKFFLKIIDGMDWLSQVLDGVVQGLDQDPENLEFNGVTVLDRQTQLIDLTKQLLEANKNRDWVLMADLLEYEISPFYKEWTSFLPELKKKVNESIN